MNHPVQKQPDEELQRLVAGFLDHSLDPEGQARLESRLREDTSARQYCASRIHFDAELQEVLAPQEPLEWSETRRVVKSGPFSWELRREQSLRFGPSSPERRSMLHRRSGWWLAAVLVPVSAAGIWTAFRPSPISPKLVLRNPSFESSDLTFSSSAESTSLLEWQDYFRASNASLVEISPFTGGKILARAGRNVVRFKGATYITQRLTKSDGSPFLARPGEKVSLKGWMHVEPERVPAKFDVGLRFVASGWPEMSQYYIARVEVPLEKAGWQEFSVVVEIPADLKTTKGSSSKTGLTAPLPMLNLEGRQVTLSIDNFDPETTLLLDDLVIEVMKN